MKKSIAAVVICLALLSVSCASQTEEKLPDNTQSAGSEKEEPEKEYQAKLDAVEPDAYSNADGIALEEGTYLSVIGRAAGGSFWKEAEKGAQQAAEDISAEQDYRGSDKIRVVYSGPAEANDVDEQVNILDEELARYPAALAIAIVDEKACEVQFDLAAESGIPVVAFESGSDYKGLMAMVSLDNEKSAQEAAERMAQETGGGEVIVISGDSGSASALAREKAFADAAGQNHPEMPVSEICHLNELPKTIADEVNAGAYRLDGAEPSGTELAEEDRIAPEEVTTENVTDYILRKHPGLKGICVTDGDTVTDLTDALERQKREGISVIGYGAGDRELEALKNGKISALIVENPFGMGYASVIAAARAALDMGNEAYIDTGYVWVDRDNMENEEIKKMLY